jgi:WD40 repeat protein
MIAGAGLDILRIWDATTQNIITDLQGIEPGHVNFSVSWSPDSQKLVTSADDFLVRIWNIADPNYAVGQLLGTISPPARRRLHLVCGMES